MAVRDVPYGEETKDQEEEKEMSFLDHLEELRWRVIYILIGLVVATIICWVFIEPLVDIVLLKPARDSGAKLINLKPFGQLMLYFQVAVVGGMVLSLPNIFLQIWKFIAPALHKKERKHIFAIVIYSTVCFLIGIAFAYFIMLPLTLKFAAQFGSTSISNQFAIDEYMNIILSVMLVAGFVFELPMISFFLSKLGILHPSFMRKYRKHALIIIMIASAFLSPGTDPVSQIVLAAPLFLLYEISIFISKLSVKKRD